MSVIMDNRYVQATTIGAGVTAVASLVAPGAVGTTLSMAGASGCASVVGALKAATSLLVTPATPVAAVGLISLGIWGMVKACK